MSKKTYIQFITQTSNWITTTKYFTTYFSTKFTNCGPFWFMYIFCFFLPLLREIIVCRRNKKKTIGACISKKTDFSLKFLIWPNFSIVAHYENILKRVILLYRQPTDWKMTLLFSVCCYGSIDHIYLWKIFIQ